MTKQFECGSPLVVRQVCAVMRSLIMDDDIRVPFGKAHDHARLIASECGALKSITSLLHSNSLIIQYCSIFKTSFLSDCKEDLETANELLKTLGALVVREEFCREVEEAGGLTVLLEMMLTYPDDEVN
jgi:armadillo repeat-containing protein 6